jgi:sec-independent protein translocase protein TatB
VNFLNIGTMELMVIITIAILVVGPKRLVQVARTIGRLTTRMRKISGEFTSIIRTEFSELDEARQEVQGVIGEIAGSRGRGSVASDVTDAVDGAKAEANQSMESLLEDGLGLGQIASELRATATETRNFVRKVSRAAEVEEKGDADSLHATDVPGDEALAASDDGAPIDGEQQPPDPGEAEADASQLDVPTDQEEPASLEEDGASDGGDAVEATQPAEGDEDDKLEDSTGLVAEVDAELLSDADEPNAESDVATGDAAPAEEADEISEPEEPLPSAQVGDHEDLKTSSKLLGEPSGSDGRPETGVPEPEAGSEDPVSDEGEVIGDQDAGGHADPKVGQEDA